MSNNTTSNVQIIGMIGVTQETPENAGASLSVFGGGILRHQSRDFMKIVRAAAAQ